MDNGKSLITISQAVQAMKTAILQSQARTAMNVNANLLALNFAVGKYVSYNSRMQKWGSGAIKNISEQLQKELPGLRGFSESSIRNLRQFYEDWHEFIFTSPIHETDNDSIQQPMAVKIQTVEKKNDIFLSPQATELGNRAYVVDL
ncbi:MAG: hypothetical protein J6Y82_11070 [Bacteroidales bacterium]|nr:hypothetical protein [Bacteroidales bacterium]